MSQVLSPEQISSHPKQQINLKRSNLDSPRKMAASLTALDFTKLKRELPKLNTEHGSPQSIKVTVTPRAPSQKEDLGIPIQLKERSGYFHVEYPKKLTQKVKLKPTVPKFNGPALATMTDFSSSNMQKGPTNNINHRNSVFAKLHAPEDEIFLSKTNKVPSLNLRTESSIDFNQPVSARLPTINFKSNEEPHLTGMLSERQYSTRDSQGNFSVSPTQLNRKVIRIYQGIKKNESLSPTMKKQEKKGVMRFGVTKTLKAIYVPPGSKEISQRPSMLSRRTSEGHKELRNHLQRSEINIQETKPTVQDQNTNLPNIKSQTFTENEKDFDYVKNFNIKETFQLSPTKIIESRASSSSSSSSKAPSINLDNEGFADHKLSEEPSPLSTRLMKKPSMDTNTSTVPEGGEKHFDSLKAPEESPTISLNGNQKKKSVTFTDSGSDPCSPVSSEGHSSLFSMKPSLKKAALEGKVLKLSGFAGESSPKLKNEQNNETDQQNESISDPGSAEKNKVEDKYNVFKKSNNGNFFEINEDNAFLQSKKFTSVSEIIRSSRRTKTVAEIQHSTAAIVVSYSGENAACTIQPRFMESYGSMCFTELWSAKSRKKYQNLRREDAIITKKVFSGSEDFLYKPSKKSQKNIVQRRMIENKKENEASKLERFDRLSILSKKHSVFSENNTPRGKGALETHERGSP